MVCQWPRINKLKSLPYWWPWVVLQLVLASWPCVGAASKPPALRLEDKRDLQVKLGAALEAAAGHLAWVLGLLAEEPRARKFPELFQRHELALDKNAAVWQKGCDHNVAETQDSVEFCAIRKLQALGTLCEDSRLVTKALRPGLRAALNALEEQQENIPGLEIRRDPLPERIDAEAFVYENQHVGSGQKVLSPSLHSTAMATLLRCSHALGRKVKMSTQTQWIVAADMAVAKVAPGFAKLTHHMLGVVWEALAYALTQLPPERPSASSKLEKVLAIVEKGMRKQFAGGTSKGVWSYSGAAAVALRLNHTGLGAAEHERLWALAEEHAQRFREVLLPGMNTTQLCTCGPVSGLAPLATALQDSRLTMLVLRLVTKDIELFQMPPGADSVQGVEAGTLQGQGGPARFWGTFLRSREQLELEGRPRSLRIDDTATCLAAVSAALRMVDLMPVAEVDVGQNLEKPPAGGADARVHNADEL